MTIFKSRTNKHSINKKLVGVYLDKKDANRLAMLSLEMGVPRTTILKTIINEFLSKKGSLASIIDNAVLNAIHDWGKNISDHLEEGTQPHGKIISNKFKMYLKEINTDLKGHRIDPEIISQIINKIKEKVENSK